MTKLTKYHIILADSSSFQMSGSQDRPFVEFVPWAPAVGGLDLFSSEPTLETESQIPRLAMWILVEQGSMGLDLDGS